MLARSMLVRGVRSRIGVPEILALAAAPAPVGNRRRRDMAFDGGPYTMIDKLTALGVKAENAAIEPILARVKDEMRRLRRVPSDAEIRRIAGEASSATA